MAELQTILIHKQHAPLNPVSNVIPANRSVRILHVSLPKLVRARAQAYVGPILGRLYVDLLIWIRASRPEKSIRHESRVQIGTGP